MKVHDRPTRADDRQFVKRCLDRLASEKRWLIRLRTRSRIQIGLSLKLGPMEWSFRLLTPNSRVIYLRHVAAEAKITHELTPNPAHPWVGRC